MRFSWTGLMVAPLLVPVLFSAAMSALLQGERPVLSFLALLVSFLVLLVTTCIVSYGTTIFVFLPCLFVLSLWRPLTGLTVCLVGLVLGAAMYVPLTLTMWKSSGPDSGPPTEPFLDFLLRWADDPMAAIFPLAGLMTAGLYWWLGTRQRGRQLSRAVPP